jgi:hypothetical protein
MIRLPALLLAASCAIPALAASPSAKRSGAKRPARKPAEVKTAPEKAAPKSIPVKAPAQSAPAKAAAPSDPLDEIPLFGLGAALSVEDGGLLVTAVRPGARAEAAGLAAGDRLLRLDVPVSSPAQAASALRAWTPGTRLPLIVRRNLEIRSLETAPVPPAKDYVRSARDLSEQERAVAAEKSSRAEKSALADVKEPRSFAVEVRADQGFWARFEKGLPAGLKKGDEISAEAATCLTADASLDFLALAPGSKLRARVVDASDDGQTRTARLAFYAIDVDGGGTYPVLGVAAGISGEQPVARVSAGGTLVSPAPLPDAKRRAPEPLLDVDTRLRVQLLEPLVVDEAPSYWRAGPGLWAKTVEENGRRLFEISLTIAERSAATAGLKVGERLDKIDGQSTEKMDFAEAINRLYGAPGSEVEVSVRRAGKSETLKLKRGVRWTAGAFSALPLPFEAR